MAAPKKNAVTKNTNWFAIWVSVAVVVVLVGLGALVVVLNNKATAPGDAPTSSSVNKETGAIKIGKGKDVVDTYVDFICSACGQFESLYGDKLQKAAADGKITLNIHPVSILDYLSQGSEYSTRAASAMYCVAEKSPNSALNFFNALYKNQPQEQTTGFTDAELAAYAVTAGAKDAGDCIAKGTYKEYVGDQTKANDIRSTPTVKINGKKIDNSVLGAEIAKILG